VPPVFLAQPDPYGPKGPDGKGWNRLSFNAHFDVRNQCGLLPIRFASLFESRTGRQRWGGYERCNSGGACSTCPVQETALKHEQMEWPTGLPLCLARVRPWALTPGLVPADPAQGRSYVELLTWRNESTGVLVNWADLRDDFRVQFTWTFVDAEGEAFWLVRSEPAAEDASVPVRTSRSADVTEHAVHGRSGGPLLATLRCHGACAHDDWHLQHLAHDLADAASAGPAAPVSELPVRLPGIRLTEFAHEDGRTVVRREVSRDYPASTLSIIWNLPVTEACLTAVAAHAARLIIC
jgi:hypothetical protein